MPFKSEAQRKWMYANQPEMAKEWEAETVGPLPKRAIKRIPGIKAYFPKKRKR